MEKRDKEVVVPLYNGIILSYEINVIRPVAATWRDLGLIILSDISQTEKRLIIRYHLSVESKNGYT